MSHYNQTNDVRFSVDHTCLMAKMTTAMLTRPVGRLWRMWLKSVDTPTPVTYPLSQKKPCVVYTARVLFLLFPHSKLQLFGQQLFKAQKISKQLGENPNPHRI